MTARYALPLAWPLPALLAWGACWALFRGLSAFSAPFEVALTVAVAFGAALSWHASTPWRRVFIAAGFPLSLGSVDGFGAVPAAAWLLPLGVLLVLYPRRAWRDAPFFPTPAGALDGLAEAVPLHPGAQILDAGCGLGAGLIELRRQYPQARLQGIEWSLPLRIACGWRCRDATVVRGDLWRASWRDHDLVYLFQRPESLPRAIEKAGLEMKPGSWLASLEFEAPGLRADRVLDGPQRRPVWLYRVPITRRPTPRT